jgi:thermitase
MLSTNSRTQTSKLLIVAIVTAIVVALAPQAASAQTAPQRYMIQLSATADSASVANLLNAKVVDFIPQLNVMIVTMDESGASRTRSALDSGLINFIEADGTVTGDLVVTDPAILDAAMTYGEHIVQAPQAWSLLPEAQREVVVAVIDTGINAAHSEFTDRLVAGYDYVNFDETPDDDHGHGTHVAGIVAAGANGVGHAGICPTCKIMPIKVLNSSNQGTWSVVARGIVYAMEHGADVINLSLGATSGSETVRLAIEQAQAAGIMVVAAAGNNGSSAPYFPAAYPGVIGVSATDNQDHIWQLSNYGENIDLAAPGYRIFSSYHDLSSGGYAYMTGTSMASPFVAGLAGLVKAYAPTALTADDITALMTANTDDLGNAGWDAYFGNGRINVCKTVAAMQGMESSVCSDSGGNDDPGQAVATIFLPVVTR